MDFHAVDFAFGPEEAMGAAMLVKDSACACGDAHDHPGAAARRLYS